MTEDREEEQHKGFKVHDRRRFSESGEPRDPDPGDTAESRTADSPPETPAPDAGSQARSDYERHQVNEINFATFVLSLSTQALAHLGEIPDPATGTISVDLPGARQLIDILGMLQDKTRGNLDPDESSLLEQILYNLRIQYVEHAQKR